MWELYGLKTFVPPWERDDFGQWFKSHRHTYPYKSYKYSFLRDTGYHWYSNVPISHLGHLQFDAHFCFFLPSLLDISICAWIQTELFLQGFVDLFFLLNCNPEFPLSTNRNMGDYVSVLVHFSLFKWFFWRREIRSENNSILPVILLSAPK